MCFRTLVLFLIAAPGLSSISARAAVPACSLSASDIKNEIQQKGVDELTKKMATKGYFKMVSCISRGEKAWLDIAPALIAKYQPDTEDDITEAISDALPINPEVVLAEPWPTFFTIGDYICSGNLIEEYNSYDLAFAELNRREDIVRRIKRADLKDKANECLAGFEQARKELARFYKVDQPA